MPFAPAGLQLVILCKSGFVDIMIPVYPKLIVWLSSCMRFAINMIEA